jgi:glutamyl-tRNA reductase
VRGLLKSSLVAPASSLSQASRSTRDKAIPRQTYDGPVRIILIGSSFKNSPLLVRERVGEKLSRSSDELKTLPGVTEYTELVTCNRIELVFATKNPEMTAQGFFSLFQGASPDSFYVRRDVEAIAHLFRVASGLDSMVLGEDQILSQVRGAGISARTAGTSKGVLSSLFDVAGSVGAKAREPLEAEGGARSVSAFALRFALEKLGRRPRKVLLIGSGKTVMLAAGELKDAEVYLATRRRALPFLGATRVPRSRIAEVSKSCDLIISATKHSGFLLRDGSLNTGKRRVILDLAFPRNVDPALNRGLTAVYDLDDLAVGAAALPRSPGADRADEFVLSEAERFSQWLLASRLSSALSNMHQWAEEVRKEEAGAALRRLPGLSARQKMVVEVMSRRLVSKLMASPTRFAKSSTPELPQAERLEVIHRVFGRGENDR